MTYFVSDTCGHSQWAKCGVKYAYTCNEWNIFITMAGHIIYDFIEVNMHKMYFFLFYIHANHSLNSHRNILCMSKEQVNCNLCKTYVSSKTGFRLSFATLVFLFVSLEWSGITYILTYGSAKLSLSHGIKFLNDTNLDIQSKQFNVQNQ